MNRFFKVLTNRGTPVLSRFRFWLSNQIPTIVKWGTYCMPTIPIFNAKDKPNRKSNDSSKHADLDDSKNLIFEQWK